MTVDPTGNSGYTFRCAGLPASASGSGSGRIDLRVVLYILSSKVSRVFMKQLSPALRAGFAIVLRLCVLHLVFTTMFIWTKIFNNHSQNPGAVSSVSGLGLTEYHFSPWLKLFNRGILFCSRFTRMNGGSYRICSWRQSY
jgi:hypothetical protein